MSNWSFVLENFCNLLESKLFLPMSCVRSGYVYTTGTLKAAGINSYYWQATVYPGSDTYFYNLHINTENAYPTAVNDKRHGLSDKGRIMEELWRNYGRLTKGLRRADKVIMLFFHIFCA